MTIEPLPDDRHAIEMHDLRGAGHFDLAAALEAERKAWRAAEARARRLYLLLVETGNALGALLRDGVSDDFLRGIPKEAALVLAASNRTKQVPSSHSQTDATEADFGEIGREVWRWLTAIGSFNGIPTGAGVVEIIAALCAADRGVTDEAVTDSTMMRRQLAEMVSSADGLLRQIDTATVSIELATEWWRLKEACLKASAAMQSQPTAVFEGSTHG